MKAAHQPTEMASEESTVDVPVFRKLFISFVHQISIGRIVHPSQQTVCIAAYHSAVAPRYDGSKERRYLDVLYFRKTPGKLDRIGKDEFRGIYPCSLGTKEFCHIIRNNCLAGHFVRRDEGFLSRWRATSGRTVFNVFTKAVSKAAAASGTLFSTYLLCFARTSNRRF